MKRYNELMKVILSGDPFAFARFNDGEMMGIAKVFSTVARGCQVVDPLLQKKLLEALHYEADNYWKGFPCPTCYNVHYNNFFWRTQNYKHLVYAVILVNNGHWKKFMEDIKKIGDRPVHWVSGVDQDAEKTGLNIISQVFVPIKNAFDAYFKVKDYYRKVKPGELVVLSCGPLSRVLAKEWYEQNPEGSYLDAGSAFDPITKNKWLNCHKNTGKYCKDCNYET